MTYAIILAAGLGTRFKKTPIKPLFIINQKPMFLHSVETFVRNHKIDKVLLVVNHEYKTAFQKHINTLKSKNVLICEGDNVAR
jgi:2-C-methyl-D-erythritol 4-phosphate cytidylyltransferase